MSIRERILKFLKISDSTVVRLYNGFGNKYKATIFGHVLFYGPRPIKKFNKSFISNTLALIRLFIVKPRANAEVTFVWQGNTYTSITEKDGFFRFDFSPNVDFGWHHVEVQFINGGKVIKANARFLIPRQNQFTYISDIDDTFLISHSSNLRKRLFVLLTENARSRDPFEGVVNHYNLLANSFTKGEEVNPFFYVSSSEWNLYDYIREFSHFHHLPSGIFLLNQLKQLKSILKTGQNNHSTKFMRIARILETYPDQLFILLGDDSQSDPVIYASVVKHFPGKLKAVYLRKVKKSSREKTKEQINFMEAHGVQCCYFEFSSEAIIHSKNIGLIEF